MIRLRNILLYGLLAFSAMFSACKKEVDFNQTEADTFLKSYDFGGSDWGTFITQNEHGDIIVVGTIDKTHNGFVAVLNENGNLQSKRIYKTDYFGVPLGREMEDGNIAVTQFDNSTISYLSSTGQEIFRFTPFPGDRGAVRYSYPIDGDSFILYASTNGSSTVWPSYTKLIFVAKDGSGGYYSEIDDLSMGGKVLSFMPTKFQNDTVWVAGTMFPGGFNSWQSPRVKFAAKFHPNLDSMELELLDSAGGRRQYIIKTAPSKDGGIYLLCSYSLGWDESDPQMHNFPREFLLMKVNSKLKLQWERVIKVKDIYKIGVWDMQVTDEDELYLTGWGITGHSSKIWPYILKTDAFGNTEFSKTHILNGSSFLLSVFASDDGNLLTVGASTAFGGSQSQMDLILLKTDAKGQFK